MPDILTNTFFFWRMRRPVTSSYETCLDVSSHTGVMCARHLSIAILAQVIIIKPSPHKSYSWNPFTPTVPWPRRRRRAQVHKERRSQGRGHPEVLTTSRVSTQHTTRHSHHGSSLRKRGNRMRKLFKTTSRVRVRLRRRGRRGAHPSPSPSIHRNRSKGNCVEC